jgi:hypothetical protein
MTSFFSFTRRRLRICFLLFVNKATDPKSEKFYNGIDLPDQWPLHFREPMDAASTGLDGPC